MGFFQKNKLRKFLLWLAKVNPDSEVVDRVNVKTSSAADVFKWFGLDGNTVSFIGHAMALQNSDDYLSKFVCARCVRERYLTPCFGDLHRNCMDTLMAIKLYGESLARHGGS